jgi:hypothetical protein
VQTSGFSDQELITIFTMGKRPASSPKPAPVSGFWGANHTWNVTDEEKLGLVAYLRTKPPRPMYGDIGIGIRPCATARVDAGPSLCDTLGRSDLPAGQDAGLDASGPVTAPTDASATSPSDAGS